MNLVTRYWPYLFLATIILTLVLNDEDPEPDSSEKPADPIERIVTPLPKGWNIVFNKRSRSLTLVEMVKGEGAPEDWTEIITVMIYHGRKEADPSKINMEYVEGFKASCAQVYNEKNTSFIERGYRTSLSQISCLTKNQSRMREDMDLRKHEILSLKSIQGKNDLYIVQKAFHTNDDDEKKRTIDNQDFMQKFGRYFSAVYVCDDGIEGRKCDVSDLP